MGGERNLDVLIEDIYQVGFGLVQANDLLKAVAQQLDFEVATLVNARDRFGCAGCYSAWGIDLDETIRAEREYGVTASTTKLHGQEFRTGEFGFREDIISVEDLRRQPYYNEFVVPNRIHEGAKLCIENSPERAVFVNLARPRGDVDRAWQQHAMKMLMPHWVRANTIHFRLNQTDVLRKAYWEAASMSRHAVVVFDNAGAIYLTNHRAEALLSGDGLSLVRGTVRASLESENSKLQQAIRTVVSGGNAREPKCHGVDIAITRPSGKRPLHAVVTPLLAANHGYGLRPAAMLAVFDPEDEAVVGIDRCRELFGFTRAEAQVAIGIMQGSTVEQLAEQQGRTVTTTRNLLKRVFQKADVSRQHELTCLMMNSPLMLQMPSALPGD